MKKIKINESEKWERLFIGENVFSVIIKVRVKNKKIKKIKLLEKIAYENNITIYSKREKENLSIKLISISNIENLLILKKGLIIAKYN